MADPRPHPSTGEPVLEVRDLCVDYRSAAGAVRAVDRVSFTIKAGEVLGLAGESGSGKSTIAQAIIRILQPPAAISAGSIHLGGQDVLAMDEPALRAVRWREVALVMQSAINALNPVLTVGDQITDAIRAHRPIGKRGARDRAAALLDKVGVGAARLGSYPHQLSGGMRQRVAIAMALALDPSLLVLDEPTTALDVIVQREILDELAELRREHGFAILFISHDLGLLFELCDRIAVLYAGAIVEEASAQALWGAPRHPYTRALLRSVPPLTGPRRPPIAVGGTPPDLRALPSGCARRSGGVP
ncbi:MAG TPA: ABC transporter ATP-binding protein, partial [Kofleriaceae bacterium]|nr:ABC transporter ATP-binding protein [Kofleriaceae bacterium]